jgi:hypothetical protein
LKGGHDVLTACINTLIDKESLKGHSPLNLTAQYGQLRNQMVPIDSLWTLEKLMNFTSNAWYLPDVQDFIEHKKEHTYGLHRWTYLICSLPYYCTLNLEK